MYKKAVTLTLVLIGSCFSVPLMAQELPDLEFVDTRLNEGEAVILTLSLSAPASTPVRVTASTRSGSAKSGQDYQSKSHRVTFLPGETFASVTVQSNEDDIDEPDQFFWIDFRNEMGVNLPQTRAKVTIVDNDDEPTIKFDKVVQSFVEGTEAGLTRIPIRVRLSHRSEKFVRFTVHTSPNTATAFEYEHVAERVLFNSRSVVFDYHVNIVADANLEGRQQFFVYMRNPSNSSLVLDDPLSDRIRTVVRILDDDELAAVDNINSSNSFAWIGAFGRRFTQVEADAISQNTEFVVHHFVDGYRPIRWCCI